MSMYKRSFLRISVSLSQFVGAENELRMAASELIVIPR